MLAASMRRGHVRSLVMYACLVFLVALPACAKDSSKRGERALGDGCILDVTGRYLSEYDIHVEVKQTDCVLFVDPPGKHVGRVLGNKLSVAGASADVVDNKIKFSNGAVWVKLQQPLASTEVTTTTLTTSTTTALKKASTASAQAEDRSTTVSTTIERADAGPCGQVESQTTTKPKLNRWWWLPGVGTNASSAKPKIDLRNPWWAAGAAGVALAGAGAVAGGVAAGIERQKAAAVGESTARTTRRPSKAEHTYRSTSAQQIGTLPATTASPSLHTSRTAVAQQAGALPVATNAPSLHEGSTAAVVLGQQGTAPQPQLRQRVSNGPLATPAVVSLRTEQDVPSPMPSASFLGGPTREQLSAPGPAGRISRGALLAVVIGVAVFFGALVLAGAAIGVCRARSARASRRTVGRTVSEASLTEDTEHAEDAEDAME